MVPLKLRRRRKCWLKLAILYVSYTVVTFIIATFLYPQWPSRGIDDKPPSSILNSLHQIPVKQSIEDAVAPIFSREPILQNGCELHFVNQSMVFCHAGSVLEETVPFIGLRLLEYHYHCSSDSIPVIDVTKESIRGRTCFWVGPNSGHRADGGADHVVWNPAPLHSFATAAILTADVFQDYYWLATPRSMVHNKNSNNNNNLPTHRLTRSRRCLVDNIQEDSALSKRLAKEKTIFDTVRILSSGKDTFSFLDELRLCDSVESQSLIPLALADSLGIPNKAADETEQQEEYRAYIASTGRVLDDWKDRGSLNPPSQEQRASLRTAMQKEFPYHLFSPSISYEEQSPKDLKTLVIIMGNIRGGEAAWNTFYKHVLDLNSADLALVIGQLPEEKRTSSLFQRAKHVYEFPEFDDWGDAVDSVHGSHWRPYILPHANDKWGTWGGVDDKAGSGAVIFMIRYYVAKFLQENFLVDQYDRFVLTRADHYYGCDHDLSLLDNNYMWVPRGEDYKFGVTDRHLICNRAQILKALDVYPPILRHPQKYASPEFADLNPEQLLRLRWEQEKLWPWLRRFDRVMFTCAAENDTTRWTEKSERRGKEGVFLKYEFEYEETTCICKTGPCDFPYTKRKMRVGYPQRDQKLV